jgi:hypothetical protein
MATVKPDPSNGGIRLGEVDRGSVTPPDGLHLHYSVLLGTGS